MRGDWFKEYVMLEEAWEDNKVRLEAKDITRLHYFKYLDNELRGTRYEFVETEIERLTKELLNE